MSKCCRLDEQLLSGHVLKTKGKGGNGEVSAVQCAVCRRVCPLRCVHVCVFVRVFTGCGRLTALIFSGGCSGGGGGCSSSSVDAKNKKNGM